MKIRLDRDACTVSAICVGIAPAVFEVGEDDRLRLLTEDVEPDVLDDVRDAVASCPNRALSIQT